MIPSSQKRRSGWFGRSIRVSGEIADRRVQQHEGAASVGGQRGQHGCRAASRLVVQPAREGTDIAFGIAAQLRIAHHPARDAADSGRGDAPDDLARPVGIAPGKGGRCLFDPRPGQEGVRIDAHTANGGGDPVGQGILVGGHDGGVEIERGLARAVIDQIAPVEPILRRRGAARARIVGGGRQLQATAQAEAAFTFAFRLGRSRAERPFARRRGGVEGAKFVMSPPLRDKRNHKPLWDALEQGFIDTVGTDHCPFDVAQKAMGADVFTAIPNGIPAIEDRVNLLYTYGVSRGRLDIHRFVDAASTKSAKLFGLFPRKGTIAVGSDADLVIYDPAYRGVISSATQTVNNDYNGFEGMEIDGKPSIVTVRGRVQVRDGKFVGDAARGEFLRRKPQHF